MRDRVTSEHRQLGNYRLLRLLGRGGFAEVYLGEHIYLKSLAALKLLHVVLTDEDSEAFVQEAQTLARLTHPHIMRVLDFAVQDGTPFLVMDYAPGGTLRHRHPKDTRMPLDTIVPYVQQVASALQYAHDQRLIHRDVKPENMLLGAHDEVVLSDFGLALLAPHTVSFGTQPMVEALAGTVSYLAPEQLQGTPRAASDQYALGVVVYEWLCGRPPFRGSPMEMAAQHLSVPPPPVREWAPDLSPAVEEVVLRALAKEPELRFPCVQDFALALEHASQPTPYYFSLPHEDKGSGVTRSNAHPEAMWKVPTTFTPLIGREQEIAAVCALLRQARVRLVTLLGTGGIGKTRLSLQVAAQMRHDFTDGVCFVGLAAISDPDLLLPTIVQELGIQIVETQPVFEQVKDVLRSKHFLLLLDNFEQLVEASLQIEELLAACPFLKIIVTSRTVLHLQAEQEFPLPPLALPNLSQLPGNEILAQCAAVALFIQRAQSILPSFQLTQANARAIAEICVRLDGLPLAIELAAARVKLLPPQTLLARLSQRLRVLTGGARTLPQRQQTLRNTLQWSYDLLDEREQRLFRLLSVFVGGSTLEAVESMGEGEEVLEGVTSLMDKSLLQQREHEGEELRLLMLETIREYGLECLAMSGEMEAAQRAHAAYYLRLAEEAEPELRGAQQVVWLARLDPEHDNLRAALRWSVESGETETALRLGGALWCFWTVRGHVSEGRQWLERALSNSSGVEASVRARALNRAGLLARYQSDYGRAAELSEESLTLSRQLGDRQGIAASLNELALVAMMRGDYVAAHAMYEESVALLRALGDKWDLADTLLLSAYVRSVFQGDYIVASSMIEESQVIFKELGDQRGVAYASSILGQLSLSLGRFDPARRLQEESLRVFRSLGDWQGTARSLFFLAKAASSQGHYLAARALFEEILSHLGELDDKWFIAGCLDELARVIAAQGQPGWAARLWGAAETLRDTTGVFIPPVEQANYERAVTAARLQAGEETFAAAWEEGRSMTPEQALTPPELAMAPADAPEP